MNTIKQFLSKYWLYALGALVGTGAGYVYWLNWACDTGCPLTATPMRTVVYGAVLGMLIFSIFAKKKDN